MLIALLIAASLQAQKLPLPAPAPVIMDYLAAEGSQVWVPAGNTGKVFVLDAPGKPFRTIEGFATKKGRNDRLMGPSSVSVSASTAFIGNRGDSSVCAFDRRSLKKSSCATVPGIPDGTFWVATTKEVWVTTPHDKSVQILDAHAELKPAGQIQLDGAPEGYAVDERKGLVYTNLEDKDRTLVIDARTRKVTATFQPACGEAGPRGIAIDTQRALLFVACTDGVVVLDSKSGERRGRIETGKGVDNIDYLPSKRRLYVSAGQAAKLTIAEAAEDGSLREVSNAEVGKGSRVVVATEGGTAYAADSESGALWVVTP
jgi:DNA-binding beta-propeller fold protein YncE